MFTSTFSPPRTCISNADHFSPEKKDEDFLIKILPREILREVLFFLSPSDLCKISLVSRYFYYLSHDPFLWQNTYGKLEYFILRCDEKQRLQCKIHTKYKGASIVSIDSTILNVFIFGGNGSGKSMLYKAFINDVLEDDPPRNEIFPIPYYTDYVCCTDSHSCQKIVFQIYDIHDLEKPVVSFGSGSSCIILLTLDITSKASLEDLDKLWPQIEKRVGSRKDPRGIFLVATKMDQERVVSQEEALEWAKKKGIPNYIEISALQNRNVYPLLKRMLSVFKMWIKETKFIHHYLQ